MMKLLLSVFALSAFCFGGLNLNSDYKWTNVTPAANYPQGYNYPVYIFGDWMVALNNGAWISTDGKTWKKTNLPEIGLNSAYQKFVQFNGAIYALGSLKGNYQSFSITPKILKTTDMNKWEVVSKTSNIPHRIFYGLAVFNNKMWMVGGYDGQKYHNDVWTSDDGVNWKQVAKNTQWSPRNAGSIAVFKDRLWMISGGVIDGDPDINPDSQNEIWSSTDGIDWKKEASQIADDSRYVGGSVAVYDGKLWLVGVNRGNEFQSGVMYSDDGRNWKEMKAPWSPRGAVAVWTYDEKLFMTGGKSSHTENGETKFVYGNDVWYMERGSK